ncbi:hypothetical protein SAMN05216551_104191 [Chitinasiproducens palmae]|uniref:Uncharacterized protein n=1 Tax=Chitinasiproducens palmae TaxID=1770053 RepID=A0A1H2PNB8_9BURK|nr:hypothetical protein SAMN05216551_104191 [Chitinasiproducens palmae]
MECVEPVDKPDSVHALPHVTVIRLGVPLLACSSFLPADATGAPPCHREDGVSAYLELLRVEVTVPGASPRPAVRSYRTVSPLPDPAGLRQRAIGGLFSVALFLVLPRMAVSHHPALWSPDFPPPRNAAATV